MTDFLILGAVALLVAAILLYLHRQKKKGVTCIGCPNSASCSGSCSGCGKRQ